VAPDSQTLVAPRVATSITEFATRTTPVVVTATTAAMADVVLTIPALPFDGVVPYELHFQVPSMSIEDGTGSVLIRRGDTQAILSTIAQVDGFTQPVGFPVRAMTVLTLPAGTYSVVVAAWKTAGTFTLVGGDGVGTNLAPMAGLLRSIPEPTAATALSPYALIELDTLKQALGIDPANTSEDPLLTYLINVATVQLEQDTMRLLHWRQTTWVGDGHGLANLYVPAYPITAVDSLQLDGVEQTVWLVEAQATAPAGWSVLVYQDRGQLRRPAGWPMGSANVRVQYAGGYGPYAGQPAIPADLQEGSVLLAADGYQTRKTGTWNAMNLSVAGQTVTLSPDLLWKRYRTLMQPYRNYAR
jgi:hypothetical protein